MKIDGRAIADKILNDLKPQVAELKAKGVTPAMAVILVSDDPASLSFIKQKQKAAEAIGAKVILKQLPATTTTDQLRSTIQQFNNDNNVHGIIIQRPLPKESQIDRTVLNEVAARKDIDGFVPNSPFPVPVAAAVLIILENVYFLISHSRARPPARQESGNPDSDKNWIPDRGAGDDMKEFDHWLKTKCSAVLGRGETAGKPIAETLIKNGCNVEVVHSQTENPDDILRVVDIAVSCVGKATIVRRDNFKPESILISVGLWRDGEGKLHGDYEEDEVKDVASYYTPTPGGVGPVNVACLMKNLVLAAQNLMH